MSMRTDAISFVVAQFIARRIAPCVSVANYFYQNIFNSAVAEFAKIRGEPTLR